MLDSISAKETHSTGEKKTKETVTAFFNSRNPNELTHADRIPFKKNEGKLIGRPFYFVWDIRRELMKNLVKLFLRSPEFP